MALAYYITHPDVAIDRDVPVPRWPLSDSGRARMIRALELPWMSELAGIWSSSEQKAIDGAEILSRSLGLARRVLPELGENDRAATGFLPPEEFWPVVEEFFAHPEQSVRGWETALHAQQRVLSAVREARESTKAAGPQAFVAHGGVGCLLYCHLDRQPISRAFEQPGAAAGAPAGSGGGYYFSFDLESERLVDGWRRIDP